MKENGTSWQKLAILRVYPLGSTSPWLVEHSTVHQDIKDMCKDIQYNILEENKKREDAHNN